MNFPALHESLIPLCQQALNSEPYTKNWIITPKISLISSFMPTEHPINAPFLSKDTHHIESFESFQYKKLANYNNRVNGIKLIRQLLILSDFRLNFSQKMSEVCVWSKWHILTYFNHSFIIKFQELVGKLFFVSLEQLVKIGLENHKTPAGLQRDFLFCNEVRRGGNSKY
jgi:hypothetical protein